MVSAAAGNATDTNVPASKNAYRDQNRMPAFLPRALNGAGITTGGALLSSQPRCGRHAAFRPSRDPPAVARPGQRRNPRARDRQPRPESLRMPPITAKPNILLIITDQQRFDTVAALGNTAIYTPNLDRLVRRGVAFSNAYSTAPVCVAARYTIMTGCEPIRTRAWNNELYPNMHQEIPQRCGEYLPPAMRRRGYRTFGVGKFHDAYFGFDEQINSEE